MVLNMSPKSERMLTTPWALEEGPGVVLMGGPIEGAHVGEAIGCFVGVAVRAPVWAMGMIRA
jgi:hypothetical protein